MTSAILSPGPSPGLDRCAAALRAHAIAEGVAVALASPERLAPDDGRPYDPYEDLWEEERRIVTLRDAEGRLLKAETACPALEGVDDDAGFLRLDWESWGKGRRLPASPEGAERGPVEGLGPLAQALRSHSAERLLREAEAMCSRSDPDGEAPPDAASAAASLAFHTEAARDALERAGSAVPRSPAWRLLKSPMHSALVHSFAALLRIRQATRGISERLGLSPCRWRERSHGSLAARLPLAGQLRVRLEWSVDLVTRDISVRKARPGPRGQAKDPNRPSLHAMASMERAARLAAGASAAASAGGP